MFKPSIAAGAALAVLALAGCSAGVHVSVSSTHTSGATPTVSSAIRKEEWKARGVTLYSRGGGAIHSGGILSRVWVFQRQCAKGHCAIYWTRPIDLGVFTAKVTYHSKSVFTASFKNESAPCTTGTSSVTKAIGLLTSDFTVHLGPGQNHMSATEHTYATTPACSAVAHTIHWTATRVADSSAPLS
jgi:hypothetical protein